MTPAELKKRRKYLGGSEIAAVLGLSPFQTAAGLWDEKMGLVEPKPTSDAMWVGIYLEDGIAKLWAHRQKAGGVNIAGMKRHKPACHPEHKFMRASPDRIITVVRVVEAGAFVHNEGVEIKCISDFSAKAGGWGRSGSKEYPEYYKVQCAWNRMIFDLPRWNLVAMVMDNKCTLKSYVYEKDEAYEANLRAEAIKFWTNHILAKVRPEEKPTHRLTSPDAQDIVSAKLPAIAPAWMAEQETKPQNATKETT